MSSRRYDLDRTPDPGPGVRLLYASISKYGGDWHSIKHTHDCTELFYVLDGLGRFEVDEDHFDVRSHDMVIVNPHIEHTEFGRSDNPLEYIVLGIEGLDLTGRSEDLPYLSFSFGDDRDDLRFYLNALIRELDEQRAGYDLVCQHLLSVLILRLLRDPRERVVVSPSRKKSSKECAKIKRYIDANFTENITLDTLASLTHMNKYHMAHVFNDEVGCSPISYLIRRRITESQRLLAFTDHSISQISGMLGFSSQSYFSQRFKKVVGVGPAQYRRETKEQQRVGQD